MFCIQLGRTLWGQQKYGFIIPLSNVGVDIVINTTIILAVAWSNAGRITNTAIVSKIAWTIPRAMIMIHCSSYKRKKKNVLTRYY